jgi:hypothetical protein
MRLSSGRRAPHHNALMRPMRAVQFFRGLTYPTDPSRHELACIPPGCINSV